MIIGISGKAGSGKDTVADLLVREFSFVKVALADEIKRICMRVFDFSEEQLWGPSEKRNESDARYAGLTPRFALQTLGTEWGRACYENVWVDCTLRIAKELLEGGYVYSATKGLEPEYGHPSARVFPYAGVVVPDVRFKNEIEGLRRGGAELIRVKRSGAGLSGVAAAHPSETEQDEIPDTAFDFVIENDGSLEELALKVRVVVQAVLAQEDDEKNAEELLALLREIGVTNKSQLRQLLLQRADDVKGGRLMEYDPLQNPDVPPFKRQKK